MDMRQKRRKFSSAFKAKVVLEALKEQSTLSDFSKRFEVHSNPDYQMEARIYWQCLQSL
ncbi:MAG: transposase [Tenacibaculum sp.]